MFTIPALSQSDLTPAKRMALVSAFHGAMGAGFTDDVHFDHMDASGGGVTVHLVVQATSAIDASHIESTVQQQAFASEFATELSGKGIKVGAEDLHVQAASEDEYGAVPGGSGGGGSAVTVILAIIGLPAVLALCAAAGIKLKRMRQAHARKLEDQLASKGGDEQEHLIQNVINDEDAFIDSEDVSTVSTYGNILHDEGSESDAPMDEI